MIKHLEGDSYECLEEFLGQTHLLIGGASGSGKSTLLNDMIWQMLYRPFGDRCGSANLVLIDPKRVELKRYEALPHTITRAVEIEQIESALDSLIGEMNARYSVMESLNSRSWKGGDIYVAIDEYADICDNKDIVDKIVKLAQLGRASKIHLWICTQRPTRDVITGRIKVNLDARIALQTACPQDSRNIIEMRGAETLPKGKALYTSPNYRPPVRVPIPLITEKELDERVAFWLT